MKTCSVLTEARVEGGVKGHIVYFCGFNEDAKLAVFVTQVSCHDADLISKGLWAIQPCFEYFSIIYILYNNLLTFR